MKQRLVSIQVIRAIAFILIFLSHAELIATGPIGVSLFLVISGFCMTYAYLDRPGKTPKPSILNNLKFAFGKVKKLYPLHLVTLLFVALVVFGGLILEKGTGKEIAEQGGYFAANGLLLQSWIPWRDGYFSFNAVSWYLSTTAFSYFLFPWVFKFIQTKDNKIIGMLGCIIIGLMVLVAIILEIGQQKYGWTRDFVKWVVYISPFYRAGDFIIGLVAGYIFSTVKNAWGDAQHTVAQIIIFILICAAVIAYNKDLLKSTSFALNLLWLPLSAACVYSFGINRGRISELLSKSRLLVNLGNVSGEAFLLHHICIKAAEAVADNRYLIAIIAFGLTIICVLIWNALSRTVVKKIVKQSTLVQ